MRWAGGSFLLSILLLTGFLLQGPGPEATLSPLPTPEPEKTYELFLPGVGGAPQRSPTRVPTGLESFLLRYGSAILLVVALVGWVLLRRVRRRREG
ncbi:MAG: hypothetical protein ACLFU8_07610 [Anaerolineales bacterium]